MLLASSSGSTRAEMSTLVPAPAGSIRSAERQREPVSSAATHIGGASR